MAQVIVYDLGNSDIGICNPAPNNGLTIQQVLEKDVPAGVAYKIMESTDLPNDRAFRGAWEFDTGQNNVVVNMDKARDVHMGEIRVSRDDKLVAKDHEFNLATDANDTATKDSVAVERQVLRDIPQNFDLTGAANATALKALWPTELL